WSGSSFQGFCNSKLASIVSATQATNLDISFGPVPGDQCILSSGLDRFGSSFFRWAWTYAKFSKGGGAPSCLSGLTASLSDIPDGTEMTLVASKLASAAFKDYTKLTSFARPASGYFRPDLLWDGSGFVILTDVGADRWRIERVAEDGSKVGAAVELT